MDRILYATRARRAVLACLRSEQRYVSAAEIHAAVRAQCPKMAISTVYRTLELLEATGMVSRGNGDGKEAMFLYCGDRRHHHAICRQCGHVDEVECTALEGIKAALIRQRGFEIEDSELAFYGRCARCRRPAAATTQGSGQL